MREARQTHRGNSIGVTALLTGIHIQAMIVPVTPPDVMRCLQSVEGIELWPQAICDTHRNCELRLCTHLRLPS